MTISMAESGLVEYIEKLFAEDTKKYAEHKEFLLKYEQDISQDTIQLIEEEDRLMSDPLIPDIVKKAIYYRNLWETFYSLPLAMAPKVVEFEERAYSRNPKVTINYGVLTSFIQKKYIPVTHAKTIYIWNGKKWTENNGTIEKAIETILLIQGLADKRKIRDTVNEVMARIQWRSAFDRFPFNFLSSEFIPLKNGVLWRKYNRLFPNSFVFGFTYCLPVKFDPSKDCPNIKKFLNSLVAPENVPILYEIPALALLQNSWYQKAYMLYGSGSNGKSTYLQLIMEFLGKDNVSNVSLQELCEDRFKAAQLVGKLANIYADIPKRPIKYTGKFKMLTGGDRITIEKKYKDPFEFENKAVLVFSANELPEVSDDTYAFWRRWVIVEFPNTFKEDPEFIKQLTTEEELSGFLNEVLKAMERIEVKGLTITNKVEEIMEEWKMRSNSVYAFVKNCLERDNDSVVSKDDVFNAYVKFCDLQDLNPLPKNKFSTELQRLVPVRTTRVKIAGKRVYAWQGIKLRCDECKKCREEEESESETEQDWLDDMLKEW